MVVDLPPFSQLVDAHWRDVARLAHALAGPDEGPDVAQQAWTKALAAYPTLRDARNLRSWLLTITARCATDEHRARARRPVLTDPPERAAPALPDPSDDLLWDGVRRLPRRQRAAVVLHYVGDLDHATVAAALDTTPAASRRLVSDALATLRTLGVTR